MKYPKRIKILDSWYEIVYVKDQKDADIDKMEMLRGQCVTRNTTLRIALADRSCEDVWGLIWHEALHVINDKMMMFKGEDEENICRIGTAINQICLDNKFNFKEK